MLLWWLILFFPYGFSGSDEELTDLKEAYLLAKGDMGQILETVILASVDDEERFRSLLAPFIESKEIPTYKQFVNENAKKAKLRKTKAEKEAKEAEEHAKELGLEKVADTTALSALIKGRSQNKFDAMISRLDDKYKAGKRKAVVATIAKKQKGRKEDDEEDVEDESDEEDDEDEDDDYDGKKRKKKAPAKQAKKKPPARKNTGKQ